MVTHEPEIAQHAERVIFLRDGLIASDKLNGRRKGKLAISDSSVAGPADTEDEEPRLT
jgi:ABC-type lipoprotein export system ATPase subunit